MSTDRGVQKPYLSVLALVSFIISFAVSRTFTTLNPTTWLITGGLHIHHFWYGLIMLAAGGWLGISYNSPRVDRLAAILFGLGGGIVGDEVGLLLTLDDYWTELTYSFVVTLVIAASILILLIRYSGAIVKEYREHLRGHATLYLGVFLAAVSIAFILESGNDIINTVLDLTAVAGCILILAYFIQRYRRRTTPQNPRFS